MTGVQTCALPICDEGTKNFANAHLPDADLAEHCRLALHDRPKNKMLWRWGVLYPLYAMAEIGIVFTDLAELIGSAIAINLCVLGLLRSPAKR